MSFRGRDGPDGGNPNKMDIGEPRRFGGMDGDKPDGEDRLSRFDSSRGRRPQFGGRGSRRPSPGRDKPFMERPSRDFGFGRDEPPLMRDRSPMQGSDDRFPDRFKKDDGGFMKRDDMGRKESGRPFYGDEAPRDRFMGMEGRPRPELSGNFNSRFDGPNDQFKHRSMNYGQAPPKGPFSDGFPKPNECEIIVVNKQQRDYAESVEARIKNLSILVDVLFLKDEALLTQTIDDIARRGSLYAMVINPQNETHGSVTVNILHGTPQEHRNMPLEDALKLVSRNFHEYIRMQRENMERERAERGPYVGNVSADREMQFVLRMLADGRWISLPEINAVIQYLSERRDKMQGAQGDDRGGHGRPPMPSADLKMEPSFKPKDDADVAQKEQDLQNRIINLMSQGAPSSVNAANAQGSGLNQNILPNPDMPGSRPNQPRMSPGMGNMRPQLGMSSNMPGMKPVRPSHPAMNEDVGNQPNLEPSIAEPANQAVFTSSASGSNLPSDSAATPTYINFDNPSVQKALDNLMQSGPSLLKNISLSSSNMSNPSKNAMPGSSAKQSGGGSGMGPPNDGMAMQRGSMGPPRGSGGMSDMGGSGPPRNSGNLDMGLPRGSGGMSDINVSGSQRGSGNAPDMMGMGSQRGGGFGSGLPDMGGMGSQRNFGVGGMSDMGRMGQQRGGSGNMGPPQGQDLGHGPLHGMGPGGNFPGQNQFGKYQGPGQQGNFSGPPYNAGPNMANMPRQNYGGAQGMGGMGSGPHRY